MKIELSGLSPEATVAAAREIIDDAIQRAVDCTETFIRDRGGTDQEVAGECAHTLAACIASRDAYLEGLRRQLDEPRAPSTLLQ